MNGIRLYFEASDTMGTEVKCYGDYQRQKFTIDGTVPVEYYDKTVVTDWGQLEPIVGGTRKIQPYWLLPIVESKKTEIVFSDYEGKFNEYPVVR